MTTETPIPPGEYEPDDSYWVARFAKKPAPAKPVVIGFGHAFHGCTAGEADELRWSSVREDKP